MTSWPVTSEREALFYVSGPQFRGDLFRVVYAAGGDLHPELRAHYFHEPTGIADREVDASLFSHFLAKLRTWS